MKHLPAQVEPERYEFAAPPSYIFELDRREFFKLLGAGVLVVSAMRQSSAQESGRAVACGPAKPDRRGRQGQRSAKQAVVAICCAREGTATHAVPACGGPADSGGEVDGPCAICAKDCWTRVCHWEALLPIRPETIRNVVRQGAAAAVVWSNAHLGGPWQGGTARRSGGARWEFCRRRCTHV